MPDEFAALVENVRKHEILQPIVVRRLDNLDNGHLRIRFGARRYRAAVQLKLADAPYVVTEDPRQFDDYAQVAENERRTALQPLEMATFIAKKLAKGESKAAVSAKLGIHPSAVTQLLCLTNDPPPFLLELYHSGRCRSPQNLYRLTKLWRIDARHVEGACAAAAEVGQRLIESMEASLRPGDTDCAQAENPIALAAAPAKEESVSSAVAATSGVQQGRRLSNASPVPKAGCTGANRSPLCSPRLFGRVDGKDFELLLTLRPSRAGSAVARFANEVIEPEVELRNVVLTRLDHFS